MKNSSWACAWRAGAVAALGIAAATQAVAIRPENTGVPASAAVMAKPQQAAKAQSDESASLRRGAVTAIDERGGRLQVQGIWLDVDAEKTQLLRNGKPAKLDSLKLGDVVRFTVAPGSSQAQSLRIVYAP